MHMYDHSGVYSAEETARELLGIAHDLNSNVLPHGTAFTLRLIFASSRGDSREQIRQDLIAAVNLRRILPDFVVGYDLVGEEDTGHSLLYFADLLLWSQDLARSRGTTLPFYFHAGETSWYEGAAENVFDAVLLNASRIGHGLSIAKFPTLMHSLKAKRIAVEICPLSNQVLQFVDDMRNHPATTLLAAGVPITINPDDPAPLRYSSVVYDWWYAST